MAEEVTSTLKLTAGDGITLVKGIGTDEGKLIINATNDSNTKIYYHTFENNSHIGLLISAEDCAEIFAEAAEQNAVILIKITTSNSNGSGDSLYVYDGKYTPSSSVTTDPYTELGFANSYVLTADSSVKTIELKIKRSGTEGSYTYTAQLITGTGGSSSQCPTTIYRVETNTNTGAYKFDDLPASTISDRARDGGNIILYLLKANGAIADIYYQYSVGTSTEKTVEFRTLRNTTRLILTYDTTNSKWVWTLVTKGFNEKPDTALNILRKGLLSSTDTSLLPTTRAEIDDIDGFYFTYGIVGTGSVTTKFELFVASGFTANTNTHEYQKIFVHTTYGGTGTPETLIASWTETDGVPSTLSWTWNRA